MSLTITLPDPTGIEDIAEAYVYLADFAMSFRSKRARFEYHAHRDEAAAYAGKLPVATFAIDVGPHAGANAAGDAVPSFDELVADNQIAYGLLAEAVYDLALSMPATFPGAALITPE